MTYVNSLKDIGGKLTAATNVPYTLDIQVTDVGPPCWFVVYDGLNFYEPRNQSKLRVKVTGIGGYTTEADVFEVIADMAEKAIQTLKGVGYRIEGSSVYNMPWTEKLYVRAFDITFQYGD